MYLERIGEFDIWFNPKEYGLRLMYIAVSNDKW